jgi:hypothetical protein
VHRRGGDVLVRHDGPGHPESVLHPSGHSDDSQQPPIDFDRLLDPSDTLCIVRTEDVQDELWPIFRRLTDALIIRVGERIQQEQRAEKPLLSLDETASLAPLIKLPQYAAILRSRDVQFVTIGGINSSKLN